MRIESPILATIRALQAEGLAAPELERRVWDKHGTECAMLALDSSGMTRISKSHGIVHFLGRYMEMRDHAQQVFEGHGSRAWRCFADNLFAEFSSVEAALAAARRIHETLRERRMMLTASEPYRVCIGIGFGRVLDDGRLGVMGEEMNLVAKLAEDIAEGGETLLTSSARHALPALDIQFEERRRTLSQVEIAYFAARFSVSASDE